jgi:methionine biosynthesis protein MetW
MKTSTYNRIFYSKIFEKKPESYYKIQEKKIEIILNLFENHQGGKILDIGCGDGFISALIRKKTKAMMHGIDISRTCVKEARKRNINAKLFDVSKGKLPYSRNYFDAVLCGDILEHIYDTEGLIDSVYKILKPHGYVIVSVPNIASWYNRFFLLIGWMPIWIESSSKTYTGNPFLKEGVGHIHGFTKKSLIDLLKFKGLYIENVKGSPMLADGTRSKKKETIWNKVDTLFSKRPSLSSTIIVKARKYLKVHR